MPVDFLHHRVRTGLNNCITLSFGKQFKNALFCHLFDTPSITFFLILLSGLIFILLLISGNVHLNPGPGQNKIKFATWNVDSLLSRDKCKINYINALDSVYNFDIFCVCESFLTPEIEDEQLFIPGFYPKPFRADCNNIQHNRPKGGVCLYFKDNIAITNRQV